MKYEVCHICETPVQLNVSEDIFSAQLWTYMSLRPGVALVNWLVDDVFDEVLRHNVVVRCMIAR
jgi:hypothetical protein